MLAESGQRRLKERGIRPRTLRAFLARLEELRRQKYKDRDALLKKIGAVEKQAGAFARLVEITLPAMNQPINAGPFYRRIDLAKITVSASIPAATTCQRVVQTFLKNIGFWPKKLIYITAQPECIMPV